MFMKSNLWNEILSIAKTFEERFASLGTLLPEEAAEYDWYNKIYTSDRFRRAHLEIVDKTQSHKILVLHCTIFPHYNDPSPIWGFDAVCGPNKITGAFHDMSSGGDPEHFMIKHFAESVKGYTWNKPRELPPWAKEIFSPYIVAAGNVNDPAELDQLCNLALNNLDYYLENVGKIIDTNADYWHVQSKYNANNKLNPHVAKSMISMGVKEEVIKKFIDQVLYPEHR